METIDLHGLGVEEAEKRLEVALASADQYGEKVVRIIHGKGKHSEFFPVLKSHVRRWLRDSAFAREYVEIVFRGEDGSPYTKPNAGETIVLLKGAAAAAGYLSPLDWEEEEERESRRLAKGLRATRRRRR